MMYRNNNWVNEYFHFFATNKDSSGSSEEEISAAMAQSGRCSDDEFNSNQFSSKTTSLSVYFYDTFKMACVVLFVYDFF